MWKWLGLAILGLAVAFSVLQPDRNLHVIVCDVGQGDAILLTRGSDQVLIDGGPNDKVLECLSQYVPFWDRQLELLVLTNGDSDHVTGLIEVLRRYEVEKLVMNNLIKDTARFTAFLELVIEKRVEVFAPKAGDRIIVGTEFSENSESLALEVLWPVDRLGDSNVWNNKCQSLNDKCSQILGVNMYDKREANEQSVVFYLKYGKFDALFTGDIGKETELALIRQKKLDDIEFLKVGHHGSRFSSTEEFLEKLKPQVAVISTGKNRYGHPTVEAIDRLESTGARVLRTDEFGNVEIVVNGESYWIIQD